MAGGTRRYLLLPFLFAAVFEHMTPALHQSDEFVCVCVCVCAKGRSVLSINVRTAPGNRSDSSDFKKGKLTFVVKKKK